MNDTITATVNIKYVNEPKPGKKRFTLKDTDGVLYGASPEIAKYITAGQTYRLTYEQQEFNGNVYNVVRTAFPEGGTSAPHARSTTTGSHGGTFAAIGGGGIRVDDLKVAERIFVCGGLNAILSNTANGPFTPEAARAAVDALRKIFGETLGATVRTPVAAAPRPTPPGRTTDDMDDDIPFK